MTSVTTVTRHLAAKPHECSIRDAGDAVMQYPYYPYRTVPVWKTVTKRHTVTTVTQWLWLKHFLDNVVNAFSVETVYQSVAVNSTCRSQTLTRQRCAQDGQKVSTFCCAPVVLKGSI